MHDIHIAGPRRATAGTRGHTSLHVRAARTGLTITLGRHPAEVRLMREAETDPRKAYMALRLGEIREHHPLLGFEAAMLILAASMPRRIQPTVLVERPALRDRQEGLPC